jgi:hypothetical protein
LDIYLILPGRRPPPRTQGCRSGGAGLRAAGALGGHEPQGAGERVDRGACTSRVHPCAAQKSRCYCARCCAHALRSRRACVCASYMTERRVWRAVWWWWWWWWCAQGEQLARSSPATIRRLVPTGVDCFLCQLLQLGFFHSDPVRRRRRRRRPRSIRTRLFPACCTRSAHALALRPSAVGHARTCRSCEAAASHTHSCICRVRCRCCCRRGAGLSSS